MVNIHCFRSVQSVPFEIKLNHLGYRLKTFRYHITHLYSSLVRNHAVETKLFCKSDGYTEERVGLKYSMKIAFKKDITSSFSC